MSGCARPCRYRGHDAGEWCNGCDYMGMTHKSRLVQVYSRLGVKTLTREARRMLEPRNCPFFEPGERGRVVSLQMPTPHRREREARSFRFDTGEARRLYEQGLNDEEIRLRVGCARRTVTEWRLANGLPPGRARRKR